MLLYGQQQRLNDVGPLLEAFIGSQNTDNLLHWPWWFEVFDCSSERQSWHQLATIHGTAGGAHVPTVITIHLPFHQLSSLEMHR